MTEQDAGYEAGRRAAGGVPHFQSDGEQIAYLEGQLQTARGQCQLDKTRVEFLDTQVEELRATNQSLRERNAELQIRLNKANDELEMSSDTIPITNEPLLGLATTEQMFRELISRFKMVQYDPDTNMIGLHAAVERALVLAEMLGGLSATEKEYREVDHG